MTPRTGQRVALYVRTSLIIMGVMAMAEPGMGGDRSGGSVNVVGSGGAGGSSAPRWDEWAAVLTIRASTFEGMRATAGYALKQIEQAKTFQDLPLGSGGGGSDGHFSSFSPVYTTPLAARILQLRKEADRLEQELKRSEKKP